MNTDMKTEKKSVDSLDYEGITFSVGDKVSLKTKYLPSVPTEGSYEILYIDRTHDELCLSFLGEKRLFHPFFVNKP